MTIPTDATHEAFIHDLDVVRVDVRMSALEPGLRTLVEKLSQELSVARADLATSRAVRGEYLCELNEIRHLLGAGPGVTALEAVKARREAQAETRGVAEAAVELLNEVRAALGVGEGDLTTEAVKRVVRERDEARAGLSKLLDGLGAKDLAHGGRIMIALAGTLESLDPFEKALVALHATREAK